jgi:hypothetical protein
MFRVSRVMSLSLLVAPAAWAAEGVVPPPAPAPQAAAPAVPGEVPLQGKPTISGNEMLRQGSEYRQEIQTIVVQIQGQVEQAKTDKDVIRLNCLLDKLTQVKVNGNMMDQDLQRLQEAVLRRDEDAQLHEYARITIIFQKAQGLRGEADACLGSETNYVGPTKVKVEAPPGIPDNPDQPAPPAPTDPGVARPEAASPYR